MSFWRFIQKVLLFEWLFGDDEEEDRIDQLQRNQTGSKLEDDAYDKIHSLENRIGKLEMQQEKYDILSDRYDELQDEIDDLQDELDDIEDSLDDF